MVTLDLEEKGGPSMALVRYLDLTTARLVDREVKTRADVLVAVTAVRSRHGGRGAPAVEVRRADGSSLTVAYEGERAAVVWVDALGESFHSVGGEAGPNLVYDYYGSWSEAPAEHCVAASAATRCLVAFALGGSLGDEFLFEPG